MSQEKDLEESKIELKLIVDEDEVRVEQNTSEDLYVITVALFIAELEAIKERALLNMYGSQENYEFEEDFSSGDSEKMAG